MTPLEALERTYAVSEELIAQVRDEDMPKPTPCEEWDVHALLGHYYNVVRQFPVMLRGEEPQWGQQPNLDNPKHEFGEAIRENLEAWHAPGAADRDSDMMPGMRMIDFNLTDAVIHTWDLAQALGQKVEFDPEAVAMTLAIWDEEKLAPARQYGAAGPEVPVPADAPPLDQLLGKFGRTPS